MAKKNNRTNRKGVVYSTDPNYAFEEEEDLSAETLPPHQQDLRISLQRLKGNKQVTRIYQFVGQDEDLKALGKSLKNYCGCGGSVKDGEILLQGDFRTKIQAYLKDAGYKFKLSGG